MLQSFSQYVMRLFVEQTTPTETIAFVLVTVVLCMVTAALLYAIVMSLIWLVRLRGPVKFRRVFLPSKDELTEHAGEYLLAIATSVILTLTLAAKHETVNYI